MMPGIIVIPAVVLCNTYWCVRGCHRLHTLHALSQDVESDTMLIVPMTSVMATIDCVSMSRANQPNPTTRAQGKKQTRERGREGRVFKGGVVGRSESIYCSEQ